MVGPLLFLIYINNLSRDLHADIKLFADGTSLFSVVNNTESASKLNDPIRIQDLAYQWKMFNPGSKISSEWYTLKNLKISTLISTLTACRLLKQHLKST